MKDESKAIHAAVYQVVSTIPYGRVTSYGHIALLLGKPQNSRQVGSAMKNCRVIIELLNSEAGPEEQIDVGTLPWWRVVSSAGKISPRENSSSEYLQAEKLKQEGVAVSKGHSVDIDEYGWFPDEVDL
ncbi:Alkyltransferase-like protein 1 [Meyerozyma guilliermondii]